MSKFFLCHASEDKEEYVRPLAQELKSRSLEYWLDEAEVEWGDNLYEKINEGLKSSDFVIAFLSHNFTLKKWPKKELYAALDIEDSNNEKKVLPLMITNPNHILEQYPLLRQKVYMNFKDGIDAIADKCEKIAHKKIIIKENKDFDIDSKEELLKHEYQKKENLQYRYKSKSENNSIKFKTEIHPGTNVLVELINSNLEEMATEIGARSSVIDALGQHLPDKAEEIEKNKQVMEALTNFAKIFAKPSLRKFHKRISTKVNNKGLIEIEAPKDVLDGWDVEAEITLIN